MSEGTPSPGLAALAAAFVTALLLTAAPGRASASAAQSVCPSTIEVDGRTAHLAAFVCGTATASVGTPWPVSIGVTVAHCTGCECGYVWESVAGSQFTRRASGKCGLGSGGSAGGDRKLDSDSPCKWGRDYIGWEPRGC